MLFGGTREIVAGTGAGKGCKILIIGEQGGENWPGTSGNGFLGFPVASLGVLSAKYYTKNIISMPIVERERPLEGGFQTLLMKPEKIHTVHSGYRGYIYSNPENSFSC